MYAIQRDDGAFYVKRNHPKAWQGIEGLYPIYITESLREVTSCRDYVENVYMIDNISVVKLTEEQLQYIAIRKLKGHY